MKAAQFFKAGDLRIEEVSDPQIEKKDQVKIKILAAGICGSDLHVYRSGAYITRTPITMGHEFSGQVTELGEKVKDFKVGDHVIGDSRVYCNNCRYCRAEKYNNCENLGFLGEACEGAFAGSIVVPASTLLKISKDVPAPIAALAEPLAVALHATGKSTTEGKRILIFGAGPIGALIHAVLVNRGVSNITIAEISEYRCGVISETKSDSTITSKAEGKFDLVFETTGSEIVLKDLLPKALDKDGETILVGLFAKETLFNFTDIVEHGWKFIGTNCFDKELPMAVKLLEDNYKYFQHVVSHQLPIIHTQAGFELLLSPKAKAMKVILTP
jgi:(R,R)-butanediol dehydrogenase/meso-butanediol dehydrogenase/diacetyl reductase